MLLFVPLSCINDKFEVYHQPISVPVVARLIKLLILFEQAPRNVDRAPNLLF